MDQNNNIQSDSRIEGINNTGKPSKEYTLPQNKEQFRQVLEQAQKGQYQQQYTESPRQSDHNSREQYDTYEPNSEYEPRSTYEQPAEPKRESFSDYRKPVYVSRFTPAKVKKKFNPLVIIIPVILLLIAAAVIFFIFFNTVSYRKAEEKYFNGIYNSFLNHAEGAEEKSKNIVPAQLEANITSPLSGTMNIVNIDLSNIYLSLNTAVQGGEIYNNLYISSGGTDINAEGWIDREKKSVLVLLPDISDIYAYAEASATAAESAQPSEYIKAFGEVFNKTSESYFELIGEPEIVKDQEFTINETVYTADKYVIHLDGIQTAKIKKALIDNLIENDKTAEILCKQMGYENKEKLLADEKIKEELDRLNTIIESTQTDYPSLDMTVYIKNKAIIGRDAVITFSEPSEDAETDSQAFFKLFEIPTDKGSLTYLYYKKGSTETLVTCEDEASAADKNVHGGKLSVSYGDNTYTVNYSEFAVTDELFQGKATIVSEKDPALTAAVELKTENDKKQFTLSVPNIITATVTLTTPSELLYKGIPALSEGEYADFSDYTHDKEYNRSDAEAAAVEKLNSDISGYILKLMGLDNPDDNGKDDPDNKPDPSDTENNTPDNSNHEDPDSTLPPEDDPNGSESSETSVSETTAADSENTTQNGFDGTTETSSTESPATVPPDSGRPQTATTVPSAPTLDVGDSQKINNAQLDSFNSGNYYKAEIYVDGASNADSSVYISEISGSFDSYIKGKALQIDFAEGYSFDSALVVLTIPSNTVTGGRNYPDSDILRGLNRYRLMGMKNSDSYESEIEFYKYSGNQIGFIVEGSGYYYLIDMDEYYHSVFGMSPDDMTVQYD